MSRWTEIAQHPQGYLLATHEELKVPWTALRLAHPMWAGQPKRDRYVWLLWNVDEQKLSTSSQSATTTEFSDRPVLDWVAEIMRAMAAVNDRHLH